MASTLTDKQHELITFIEQRFLVHGQVPTKDMCVRESVCSAAVYTKSFTDSNFRHALITRGITLRGFDEDKKDTGILTEQQLVAANTMLDLRDGRSQKKRLQDLGLSTAKWDAWLRDPAFQSYLRARAENLLGDSMHESHLALVDRVRSGDINAIKYFNEITGRYVPNANDKVDVNAILMAVLEVLQRHVTDADVLLRVSEDLRALSPAKPPTHGGFNRQPAFGVKVIEGTIM